MYIEILDCIVSDVRINQEVASLSFVFNVTSPILPFDTIMFDDLCIGLADDPPILYMGIARRPSPCLRFIEPLATMGFADEKSLEQIASDFDRNQLISSLVLRRIGPDGQIGDALIQRP